MDNGRAVCACCRDRIHAAWRAWSPLGTVTCARPSCVGWASSRRWQLYGSGIVGRPRPRPRSAPRCDYCGGERPKLRDCFRNDDGQVFCSLTCERRAARIGR